MNAVNLLAGTEPDDRPLPIISSERAQARREIGRLLLGRPGFIFGIAIVAFWLAVAAGGEWLVPYSPYNEYFHGHLPPSLEHYFGTDRLGRDVFSRVIVGARDVLVAGPIAGVIGVMSGTLTGLVMGYYQGLVDDILSRLVDAFLSLPVILIALLALVVLGSSTIVVILVVGILYLPSTNGAVGNARRASA